VLKKNLLPWIGIVFFASSIVYASPYGINFSTLLIDKDPENLHGVRGSFQYFPSSWVWEHVHIFFDVGVGHWWVRDSDPYRIVNIYSIAPVFRYYFKNNPFMSPFLDISIGPSYLTRSRIDHQKLGIHFAFQDQVGLGTSFGPEKKTSVSLSALHYSNGSIACHNSGMTIPLMLNLSYRF
jgi:hypothetical protein